MRKFKVKYYEYNVNHDCEDVKEEIIEANNFILKCNSVIFVGHSEVYHIYAYNNFISVKEITNE